MIGWSLEARGLNRRQGGRPRMMVEVTAPRDWRNEAGTVSSGLCHPWVLDKPSCRLPVLDSFPAGPLLPLGHCRSRGMNLSGLHFCGTYSEAQEPKERVQVIHPRSLATPWSAQSWKGGCTRETGKASPLLHTP